MTLYQFKLLDETEQIMTIYDKGVYLADRVEGDYIFTLYQIDSFYVEEHWTASNVRRAFISFISHEKLNPYLDNIDISSLIFPSNAK